MSEAAFGGHEILNHERRRIRVTQRAIRSMDRRNFLKRDRATGLLAIKPDLMDVMAEMEYGTPLMRELGPDCSGPDVPICNCRECQRKASDIDKTMTPEDQHREAMRIVAEIRARRTK